VLGHTKTILVLLASWWVFHEPMIPRKLLGMALAVAGMAAYGHAAMQRGNAAQRAKKLKDAAEADVTARVLVPGGLAATGKDGAAQQQDDPDSARSSSDGLTTTHDNAAAGLQRRTRASRQLA
jgi:hypothetical protein